MRDMATGRARGFAFVEMATDEDAQQAISMLNNHDLGGRNLTVNEARPKVERGAVSAAVAAPAAAVVATAVAVRAALVTVPEGRVQRACEAAPTGAASFLYAEDRNPSPRA